MTIPDQVRKCVAFVGMQLADSSYVMAGSGFFFGREPSPGIAQSSSFITARHVIEGISRRGLTEVFLRLNLKEGNSTWVKTELKDWFYHPTDTSIDVALLACYLGEEHDHVVISHSLCASEQILQENEVGLGEEVFITGLFRHHYGNRRNIPIVRIGNIACLVEEKIRTKDMGEIDAYLIEARSIGGLSGSPVFLNLGVTRSLSKQIKHSVAPVFYLFGLVHGHYDVSVSAVDTNEVYADDTMNIERVNTGIAIIVPIQKIEEVFRLLENALTSHE